jgi:hypothetical protein
VPAVKDDVDSVATPEELTVADPSCVEPFIKFTVPVGAVVPEPFTVAVNVKDWPVVIEFADADNVVVVDCANAVTVTEAAADALAARVGLPP